MLEKTEDSRCAYKMTRNHATRSLRVNRESLESSIITNIRGCPKKFWKYVNRNKTDSSTDLCIFDDPATSELISDDQKKAEVFNQVFSSVFVNPNDVHACSPSHFTKFVSADKVPFNDSDISSEQVLKIFRDLSVNKAPDIDGILTLFFRRQPRV